jgi:hypothetical protein
MAMIASAASPMVHSRLMQILPDQPICAALPRGRRKLHRRLAEGGAKRILRPLAVRRKPPGIEAQGSGIREWR